MGEDNLKYKNWLAQEQGITDAGKRLLYDVYGDYGDIYRASEKELVTLPFCKNNIQLDKVAESKKTFDLSERLENLKRLGVAFSTLPDADYPEKLRQIHTPPFQLFYKGSLPQRGERLIAMVGARRCTGYGKNMSVLFGETLAKQGYGIVSGMADGIDGISHRAAIGAGGSSYAILGCGVDVCYPAKNQDIYEKLPKNGGVISEFAPGTAPLPEFFPRRNRIISGLSDVVLVMEARARSGSLITAMLALDQGKDIYALPGRITDGASEGCNSLISQGAGVLCSLEQLLKELGEKGDWEDAVLAGPGEHSAGAKSKGPKQFLEKQEALVYSCLDFNAKSVDELLAETALPLQQLLSSLLRLCDLHLAEESFINQYVKL